MEDTICAISTAMGEGGIGIVRLSGEDAILIGNKVFQPINNVPAEHRKLRYGWIKDGDETIDEVLFVEMYAPNTYTKEDMVEIYTHGGSMSTKRVLERLLKEKIRLAERGEFTKRAFLNGRIDLVQAEAVIDIINARTENEHKAFMEQLQGGLTKELQDLSSQLTALLAHVEMVINFTEDLEDDLDLTGIDAQMESILEEMKKLVSTKNQGKILREGIETTILGKPNVGKSSLMNALLREERAIVTDVPGTTRDVIQEYINLDGVLLKINDTAGIRDTADIVEKIGVQKTLDLLNKTDLILLLLDQSTGLTEEDEKILNMIQDKPVIVLLNKTDLDQKISEQQIHAYLPHAYTIQSSMVNEQGVEELVDLISDIFQTGKFSKESVVLTNVRQTKLMEEAYQSMQKAYDDFKQHIPIDCVEVYLRSAWNAIGEITGQNVAEDVIDRIFADFCIGK